MDWLPRHRIDRRQAILALPLDNANHINLEGTAISDAVMTLPDGSAVTAQWLGHSPGASTMTSGSPEKGTR